MWKDPDFRHGVCLGAIISLVMWVAIVFGLHKIVTRAPAAHPAPDHHTFYYGRPRCWAGDDNTEVEVFRDQAGAWQACVWARGKCWRGKLTTESRRGP